MRILIVGTMGEVGKAAVGELARGMKLSRQAGQLAMFRLI